MCGAPGYLVQYTEACRVCCFRWLLELGCEVDIKDKKGGTPLWRAAENGHADIVTLLLAYGADVRAKHHGLETALFTACLKGI